MQRTRAGHTLIQLGAVLFLLGLLTGLLLSLEVVLGLGILSSPRLGLSAHLQGVMVGTFLVAIGLAWPRVELTDRAHTIAFWSLVWSGFASWGAGILASWWGVAGRFLPIAGEGADGSSLLTAIVVVLLGSVGVSWVLALGLTLKGLRAHAPGPGD
jgi:hydroxylaminobenzene mutase